MPSKAPSKKASPAVEPEPFWNQTKDSIPASTPAPLKKSKDVPTSLDVLLNILGVLCDVRKLLGPTRPDFKEEQWYKVK